MEEHYATVLAPFYTWSLIGDDFGAAVDTEVQRFKDLCPAIPDLAGADALDLGCGSGLHSLALAKLGMRVRGVDLCQQLLDEMAQHASDLGLSVTAARGDIMNPAIWTEGSDGATQPAVITCMGDTLSHLGSIQEVEAFLASAYPQLRQDGMLLLSYRDQEVELVGPARVIPVRSSPTRIHTCFLEFEPEHIHVNDIFHQFDADSQAWTQHVGGFTKLRITTSLVITALEAAGFEIQAQNTYGGMSYVCATPLH
ncbi:SAM binding domain-containing protein [Salpingoeca rosetta]|uniref:SAM binding domain-containing protein n=1 Tax=Salpingoeca rosetta (strain ATCC 50818 / BSB-021) TaxID=946362 RepID=F2U2D8_SALR5|nr:SAM binding domain-containing protein [Salpingoeca rosetta]EGD81790.1 SAM binding domain-containing protein [Salpingoeca rosetta]|eukprot:XP_004996994.1 SAM binding domain-containing protein [Salpingoeca rosetta]